MPKPPQRIAHEVLVLAETLFTACRASTLCWQDQFAAQEILHTLLNNIFAQELQAEREAIAAMEREDD